MNALSANNVPVKAFEKRCARCKCPMPASIFSNCARCRKYFRNLYKLKAIKRTPAQREKLRARSLQNYHAKRAHTETATQRAERLAKEKLTGEARVEARKTGAKVSDVLARWGADAALVERYRSRGA